MSAHLVRLSGSRGGQTLYDKADAVIVWVEDDSVTKPADARAAAAAARPGPDGYWADAVVLELSEANLATAIPVKSIT
ncbi:hypothetical protein P9A54_gp22 [Xanthomonas phage vB_Xar_IVIA-DoCa10]|uniref:Uncharacterized protein n=1 Tax=Xanthomonas phage vB_Xar_IVIA-DoCa10 TaxID=2975529 RepID=A0A9X9NZ31_9CAUD|nr:hypothetical protein P9A54_gp22 [Xanthomonas phage vB_Xar_IVIA-DoCa10]UYA99007.1 hypothetical protein IVIADoCa10_22 [Xanthomonas phage vB_Xar_IVIA-DoCa10]